MRRLLPLGPLASLATIVVAVLVGGVFNTANANGRVVDDWANTPLPGADVSFGSRTVTTDADGNFDLGPVPRGAKLQALKRPGYGRADFGPDQHEIRLQPAVLTVVVTDSKTGQPITTVKAQKDGQQIGNANGANDMAIGPHPGKDVPFIVCAKDYAQKQVSSNTTVLNVTLDPQPGSDCPALPSESPSPSPPAPPSESPSASPSASPAASPSSTP